MTIHPLIAIFLIAATSACTGSTESTEPAGDDGYLSYEEYTQSYAAMPANRGADIVKRAIEHCGGWEAFTGKEAISYRKTTSYVDSTGAVTRQVVQFHEYNLFPSFKVKMTWTDNGDTVRILNNGQQAWKLRNGEILTAQDDVNSAYNASYGAHYVVFMPFKLADPEVDLSYAGEVILPDGRAGEAVDVVYQEAFSTTTDHDWRYFFDPATGEILANFLAYPNGYSYTEYVGFAEVDGLMINNARRSYRTDESMSQLTLSTIYENSEITFRERYPDHVFEPASDD